MAFVAGNPFLTSGQIILSNHHLAALGAAILFLLEGVLIGAFVFPRVSRAKAPGSGPQA
jgi:hypothetical protein